MISIISSIWDIQVFCEEFDTCIFFSLFVSYWKAFPLAFMRLFVQGRRYVFIVSYPLGYFPKMIVYAVLLSFILFVLTIKNPRNISFKCPH